MAPQLLPAAEGEKHHPLDQMVEEIVKWERKEQVQALREDPLAHDILRHGRAVRAQHRDEEIDNLQTDLAVRWVGGRGGEERKEEERARMRRRRAVPRSEAPRA